MAKVTHHKARWTTIERVLADSLDPPSPEEEEDIPSNLTPFFSRALPEGSAMSDSYWDSVTRTYGIEEVGDGWAHIALTGSTSATQYIQVKAQDFVEAGKGYTLLLEVRNLQASGRSSLNITTSSSYQLGVSGAAPWDTDDGEGAFHIPMTISNAGAGLLVRMYLNAPGSSTVECDFRLSLYEGVYDGIYVPWIEPAPEETS